VGGREALLRHVLQLGHSNQITRKRPSAIAPGPRILPNSRV